MNDSRNQCATARDKFEVNNLDLFDGSAWGQYLRNRILKAYEQGWWDRDALEAPPLNHDAFGHTPRCTTGGCKP